MAEKSMINPGLFSKSWWRVLLFSLILIILSGPGYGKDYKGGELRTYDTYRYGRFEVRMKSVAGSGVLSSFFTYHDFTSGGAGNWNEIDWEWLGNYDDKTQTNLIIQNQWDLPELIDVDFNPHEDFHTYAFEWTPDYVAFFIDDQSVRWIDNFYVDSLYHYQKIMMNIWQPIYEEWVGEFDEDILPVYAYYDWVKYYMYVPGTGNYGTDNNFFLLWGDEFETWDTDRWQKANHTFYGNNCDFIYDNVVFYDGYLILCLTTPDDTGYGDDDTQYILHNPGFESDIENWSVWPENLTNYIVVTEPVLHGNHSLKLFGQNSGTTNSISVYQTFNPSQGDEFTFSGYAYSASDDPISGDNSAYLELTFFDENWNILGEQPVSSSITSSSPTDQWIPLTVSGTAPTGVVSFNVAMIFKQIDDDSGSVFFDDLDLFYSNLSTSSSFTPANYNLFQIYPNPFNNRTIIQFKIEDFSPVTLTIVNVLGQHITTVVDRDLNTGEHKFFWDGTNYNGKALPSGIYFAILKGNSGVEVQKIVLLK
jgi:hypothetical protein